MTTSIDIDSLRRFAAAWYRALDVHAPIQECFAMLAEHGLSMHFPDGDINDALSFQKWYERVTHLFFDEEHTVRKVEVLSSADGQADLAVLVRWQAHWWDPPAATSQRVDLESAQRWTVRRCAPSRNPFGLEIVSYQLVGDFQYAPGSATLSPPAPGNADELIALNEQISVIEQQGGPEAVEFFSRHLSQKLVFRRASGKIVGKYGPDGFLEGLAKNPFRSRVSEDISVTLLGDRALVTLFVVGTRKDDGSVHCYRNIRLFSRGGDGWVMEFWYNHEVMGVEM